MTQAFKANQAHKLFAEHIKTVISSCTVSSATKKLIPFKYGEGVNILGWLET